jgi:hypothetical protein
MTEQEADAESRRREDHKRMSVEQFNRASGIAAWLLATLVAVNTSGAGASLAFAKNMEAAGAFAIGIVLAIFSGITSWLEAFSLAQAHHFASLDESDLRYDEEMLQKYRVTRQSRSLLLNSFVSNILSLAAFSVGCVLASGLTWVP